LCICAALKFGAHNTVNSRDSAQLQKLAGSLDFILVTANSTLDRPVILDVRAPWHRPQHREVPDVAGQRRAGTEPS
jgi:hypothetical protein